MNLDDQLLFFVSAIGVFNGLLLSLYFILMIRPKRLQYQLFGWMLLMLTIRIGKSVLYFFSDGLSRVILQIGLSACVFIGPFLLMYVRSVLSDQSELKRTDKLQIIALLAVVLIIGLVYPYPARPEVWNGVIIHGIYAIWAVYIFTTGYSLKTPLQKLISLKQLTSNEKWLVTVFSANALVCLVYCSVLYFGYPSYIYGSILFSLFFYVLLAAFVLDKNRLSIIEGKKNKYSKKISEDLAEEIKGRLFTIMEDATPYKDPSLKLEIIANQLNISSHVLSQFLNDNLGKNFSSFINEYRIQAAIKILESDHRYTMEGIGNEVGFRSKSSFYAAFKKVYNMTPQQYLTEA